MFEQQQNCQAMSTKVFFGDEDDVVDTLLSVLRNDNWENLKMHYETGSLTAEKTMLRIRKQNGTPEEVPVILALSASWFEANSQVEVMVEVVESENDWTTDECVAEVQSIIQVLHNRFGSTDPDGSNDMEGDED